jgi:hypothetical protein
MLRLETVKNTRVRGIEMTGMSEGKMLSEVPSYFWEIRSSLEMLRCYSRFILI